MYKIRKSTFILIFQGKKFKLTRKMTFYHSLLSLHVASFPSFDRNGWTYFVGTGHQKAYSRADKIFAEEKQLNTSFSLWEKEKILQINNQTKLKAITGNFCKRKNTKAYLKCYSKIGSKKSTPSLYLVCTSLNSLFRNVAVSFL